MGITRHLSVLWLVALLGGVPATGATWYVGSRPGDDFTEIQPAIAAASEGDLILVRPDKSYAPFTLNKALTVRSTTGQFYTRSGGDPTIENIPSGKTARLAGFSTDALLRVRWSEGSVVIEDGHVVGGDPFYPFPYRLLEIDDCRFVHLNAVEFRGVVPVNGATPTALIKSSRVLFTTSALQGWNGQNSEADGVAGTPGSPGLVAMSCDLVIARSSISGGDGGRGFDEDWEFATDGGAGGTALRLEDGSRALLLGCCGDEIRGGHGGDGGQGYGYAWGAGGDGGHGIEALPGSSAEVSQVLLKGGKGGDGVPDGKHGSDFVGDVTFRDPPYPTLDMEGDLHPGSSFAVTVRGEPDWAIVLLASDTAGWIELPGRPGPPLTAIPAGTFFLGLYAGLFGPTGERTFVLSLLNDPVLRGFALTLQMAALPGDGTFVLSNAATRIVGE
ncbi:MAG: hypothetical protein AB1486_07055 [Planctomycetota bacterium]